MHPIIPAALAGFILGALIQHELHRRELKRESSWLEGEIRLAERAKARAAKLEQDLVDIAEAVPGPYLAWAVLRKNPESICGLDID